MMGRIEDLDVARPLLRVVGAGELERPPDPCLETVTSLQLMKVRVVCDIAADQNVACFEDPTPAYAVALASALGLGTESVEAVFMGALLRDAGNLRVSRRVLFGLRPMTEAQRLFLRMYAEYSGQICETLGLPELVTRVVREHHERWDGSGYLDGLRGEEACLEGRVVALVDVYDRLTRPRLGQKGLPEAKALRKLRRAAGVLFEPELVEAWAEVMGEGRLELGA